MALDGSPCTAETRGLLKRAHIIAGEIRYIGKETDSKWEEGDEISVFGICRLKVGQGRTGGKKLR